MSLIDLFPATGDTMKINLCTRSVYPAKNNMKTSTEDVLLVNF
jgi:hypothetical protein